MKSISQLMALLLVVLLVACSQSEYQKLVKSELKKGIRLDSIFWGIHFGQTSKEFFGKCWELNEKGILSHGPKNMNVQYNMIDADSNNIMLLFYPVFDKEDRIRKMDMEFSYAAWSPWSQTFQADNLVPTVRDTLEDWYPGNKFLNLEVDGVQYWVKIDGNRRISMKSDGKQNLLVKVVDMLNEEN